MPMNRQWNCIYLKTMSKTFLNGDGNPWIAVKRIKPVKMVPETGNLLSKSFEISSWERKKSPAAWMIILLYLK